MNCPNCNEKIPESALKKWWASRNGKKSKRKISAAEQSKMQEARRLAFQRKKAERESGFDKTHS